MSPVLLVASIDFGTTYSGWAFSFKHEFESNPLQISARNWLGGGRLVSSKAPTCVLFEPDGKTLYKFGYEAESKYAELAAECNHEKYYYFRRFKMMLYAESGLKRDIQLQDETGKSLPAMLVFTEAIKFMKSDMLEISKRRLGNIGIRDEEIKWVLTVPAIWNDAAKHFMREAGEQAGIDKHKLFIALEPEVASIYSRHLPVDQAPDKTVSSFKPGKKYLIIDAGGGTVDCTVHEVTVNGDLKEIHKATGGAWGGTKVDEAFEEFIEIITKNGILNQLKTESMDDYLDIIREFEVQKRDVRLGQDKMITIRIPLSFVDLLKTTTGKSLLETVSMSRYKGKIEVTRDKLRIHTSVIESFFESSISSILRHVEDLLKQPDIKDCQNILMVGGFSESNLLQGKVKLNFPSKVLIVPAEAGLAVLKGAVIYGHIPSMISERVCRYTYGERLNHKYVKDVCPERECPDFRDLLLNRCSDYFEVHVRSGQSVKLDHELEEHIAYPFEDDQTNICISLYISEDANVKHVTESGCIKIGTFSVQIPDTSLGRKRAFGTTFSFGGTEIEVKVTDKVTGNVESSRVDFLG